jgi:IMP dehydrogenase
MKYKFPLGLSYDDVLLIPQYSEINSRSDVDLSTQVTPRLKLKIPLISINMSDVTGIDMAISMGRLGGMGFLPRFMPIETQANWVSKIKKAGVYSVPAIGIKEGYLNNVEILVKAGADAVTIDVAHGHLKKCLEVTKQIKGIYNNAIDVISGVIGTYEGAYDLFKAGADSVRVGVGPGTICITRIVTGFGVPQITAVLEASRAARKFGKTVICDGGTKNSGDIVKGLAAGASAVIAGSQFAGCNEAPGKIIVLKGQKYKTYNASTSLPEKLKQIKNNGMSDRSAKHIEGVESIVPCKGPVSSVIDKLLTGVRSGFSYSGAGNVKELWQKAKFMRVTNSGQKENGVHDVITTL